jgi:hypothetical protein
MPSAADERSGLSPEGANVHGHSRWTRPDPRIRTCTDTFRLRSAEDVTQQWQTSKLSEGPGTSLGRHRTQLSGLGVRFPRGTQIP